MPVTPTQGKHGSARSLFLVDGFDFLAAKLQALRYKISVATEKTDGMGDLWDEHTPTGKQVAELAQEGAFFDTAVGSSHAALATSFPVDPNAVVRIAVLGLAGNAIGQPFMGFEGVYTGEYEVLSTVGNLQRANAAHIVTGKAEEGVILHALTTETADATTEPASSVDNTLALQRTVPITSSVATGDFINTPGLHGLAPGDTVLIAGHSGSTPALNGIQTVLATPTPTQFSITTDITVGGTGGTLTRAKTNNGGAGYLEVKSLTLGTFSDALVVQRHSADDSTYADLLTFTAVTATRGAQRVAVSGVVNRYLAQNVDFRGAGAGGSITYMTGFARG